jgi:hypothetical protein
MVAKVREGLAENKQATQKFDGKSFNLKKLNGLEVGKLYQIEITNKFSVLGTLSDDDDINMAWENIKENIITAAKKSLGLHELNKQTFFDKER